MTRTVNPCTLGQKIKSEKNSLRMEDLKRHQRVILPSAEIPVNVKAGDLTNHCCVG